ncbi:hypothetical protein F383_36930 [Gossypium arboreum]|uniref:Uncharacterized protein n=1 Tax=Gossypium arboreum TaxID=29729 RepID=A0A0B0MBV5_GOSAR|nr:hypothetical protein F383_36930 [Gossypium arboreum]
MARSQMKVTYPKVPIPSPVAKSREVSLIDFIVEHIRIVVFTIQTLFVIS